MRMRKKNQITQTVTSARNKDTPYSMARMRAERGPGFVANSGLFVMAYARKAALKGQHPARGRQGRAVRLRPLVRSRTRESALMDAGLFFIVAGQLGFICLTPLY